MEKNRPENQFKLGFWEGLGLYLGGGWESCGKDLEALGASWAVLRGLFFMLVFGVVFKSALGGLWAGFWVDFKESGTDFGRVLASFGRKFREFWLVLGYCGLHWVIGTFWDDLGRQKQAKASKIGPKPAKASNSKQKRAKAGTIKCGTDCELKL